MTFAPYHIYGYPWQNWGTSQQQYMQKWNQRNQPAGSQYPDWSFIQGMPGLKTLMSGGAGAGLEGFDPTAYTTQTRQQLEGILSGGSDMPLVGAQKFARPMREQTKLATKTAKKGAIESLKSAEGAGYDPAAAAFMGGVFDVLPAQKEPEIALSSEQMATARNAPIIAANTDMKVAAQQGLSNLAMADMKAITDMMGLKAQVQNQAYIAALEAITEMSSQMMSMMPKATARTAGQGSVSYYTPYGVNPYQYWYDMM